MLTAYTNSEYTDMYNALSRRFANQAVIHANQWREGIITSTISKDSVLYMWVLSTFLPEATDNYITLDEAYELINKLKNPNTTSTTRAVAVLPRNYTPPTF